MSRVIIFSRTLLSNSVVTNYMWQVGTENVSWSQLIYAISGKQDFNNFAKK